MVTVADAVDSVVDVVVTEVVAVDLEEDAVVVTEVDSVDEVSNTSWKLSKDHFNDLPNF